MRLEKEHHFPDALLLTKSLRDLACPHRTDSRNVKQLLGLVLNHIQSFLTKFGRYPPSHLGADPFDQTGRQVLFNACNRGRRTRLCTHKSELFSEFLIKFPSAL